MRYGILALKKPSSIVLDGTDDKGKKLADGEYQEEVSVIENILKICNEFSLKNGAFTLSISYREMNNCFIVDYREGDDFNLNQPNCYYLITIDNGLMIIGKKPNMGEYELEKDGTLRKLSNPVNQSAMTLQLD